MKKLIKEGHLSLSSLVIAFLLGMGLTFCVYFFLFR